MTQSLPEPSHEAGTGTALQILVVDDEAIARLILSRPLKDMGHHIAQAASGNEAIRVLQQQSIDLILLDIGMRDGDGFMVLETLRQQHSDRWVPVIVTSGHQSEEQITHALDLGADDYLVKPLNIGFLRYKIRNFQRVISLQKQNLSLLASVMQKQASLQERIALEFEYSTRIQKTLLFGSVPLALGGFYTSARAQAAQGVNGDFIDIISVYPDTVDLIAGDVMGKGALAAIQGAELKLEVQRQITQRLVSNPQQRFSVGEMVNAIHQSLSPKLIQLESFITFLYARLDKAAGTLSLVSCGNPPLIVMDGGKARFFGANNLPLGVLLDEVYQEDVCAIGPGAAVISYSDGLTESRNVAGEAYGEEQLLQLLQQHPEARWGANALGEVIFSSVMRFVGERPLGDDLTLMVAKVPDDSAPTQRLILPRQLEHIAELRHFIGAFARIEQLDEILAERMTLVAVEAFTNTVRHSSNELLNSSLEVQACCRGGVAWLSLEALGSYFDPDEATPEPLDPTDLSREGGFGLHIMRALTDHFAYRHVGGVNRSEFGFEREPAPH